jgi:hypothetical protein
MVVVGRISCGTPYKNLEDGMAVSSVSAKETPQAQLRSLIEMFDLKIQRLIRSIRSALRKRLPAANELAYDKRTALEKERSRRRWWPALMVKYLTWQ